MRNLLHRIRHIPLEHNLTQPIPPYHARVLLLRSPGIDQIQPFVTFVVVMSPQRNVPGKTAKDGPAEKGGARQDLPVEGTLLIPGQAGQRRPGAGREEIVFAHDLDVVRGGGGFGGEFLNVFFAAAGGVDEVEALWGGEERIVSRGFF